MSNYIYTDKDFVLANNKEGMSRRNRLMMDIYFQNPMRRSVQKKYIVTNRPDSGVLIIRASISDATTGSTLSGAISGDYGNVVIEGEIQVTLQKGSSFASLVKTVDTNLSSGKNGTKKVYRIDVPGKDETVFGVAISKGAGADRTVMGNIDVAQVKHSAHLPYEILVSGKKAYMLNGRFRIALSFPDLTMGQFMTISSAPDSTEAIMKGVTSSGAQLSSN